MHKLFELSLFGDIYLFVDIYCDSEKQQIKNAIRDYLIVHPYSNRINILDNLLQYIYAKTGIKMERAIITSVIAF